MITSENKFWPCILVEHENHNSVILSDFHYFDDYFGDKGGGGYSVERLAKKLTNENGIKGIKFDSEAGMFCAYSTETDKLIELCQLFRKIVGNESDFTVSKNTTPLIPLDKAEELLIKGFVQGTDKASQDEFFEKVPYPSLTNKQSEYLQALKSGTEAEKIYAAKRINSEARTKTRNWKHYLSHPNTITTFLEALDRENTPKVYQELIWALVFICRRHLPDLRCVDYFIKALENKNATVRWLGLMGLEDLYEYPKAEVLKLKNDKSEKVQQKAEEILKHGNRREFPVWMFSKKYETN